MNDHVPTATPKIVSPPGPAWVDVEDVRSDGGTLLAAEYRGFHLFVWDRQRSSGSRTPWRDTERDAEWSAAFSDSPGGPEWTRSGYDDQAAAQRAVVSIIDSLAREDSSLMWRDDVWPERGPSPTDVTLLTLGIAEPGWYALRVEDTSWMYEPEHFVGGERVPMLILAEVQHADAVFPRTPTSLAAVAHQEAKPERVMYAGFTIVALQGPEVESMAEPGYSIDDLFRDAKSHFRDWLAVWEGTVSWPLGRGSNPEGEYHEPEFNGSVRHPTLAEAQALIDGRHPFADPRAPQVDEARGRVWDDGYRAGWKACEEHAQCQARHAPQEDRDGPRDDDALLTCAHGCGETPHRFRPSPEAGPYWRCSECGGITSVLRVQTVSGTTDQRALFDDDAVPLKDGAHE